MALSMGAAMAALVAQPRFQLGTWPSPLQSLLSGAGQVHVKRDDLSGFGRGGAKTRKLELLLGAAKARGSRSVVAMAGNISNLAFDLDGACRVAGLELELFVVNDPPTPENTRREIFSSFSGRIQFLGQGRITASVRALSAWAGRRARGERPLFLPPGASRSASVAGNALGVLELAAQLAQDGKPLPRRIYVSLATGNTAAGFLLGAGALAQAGHAPIQIIGVSIYPGRAAARARWQYHWACLRLGLRLPAPEFSERRSQLRGVFGDYDKVQSETCLRLATQGLELDPIFGGKTWCAMEEDFASGRAEPKTSLFWNCGYTPEWARVGRLV